MARKFDSPCVRECPNRSAECVKTCEALKLYEIAKRKRYAEKNKMMPLQSIDAERAKRIMDRNEKKKRH